MHNCQFAPLPSNFLARLAVKPRARVWRENDRQGFPCNCYLFLPCSSLEDTKIVLWLSS